MWLSWGSTNGLEEFEEQKWTCPAEDSGFVLRVLIWSISKSVFVQCFSMEEMSIIYVDDIFYFIAQHFNTYSSVFSF